MSYVSVLPEMLAAAATDLAGIGSSLGEANTAAAEKTTAVIAAAEDEVSVAVASLFSGHAQEFQALSAQAAAFHAEFAQTLGAAGKPYASAEAAGSSALHGMLSQLVAAETPNLAFSLFNSNINFHSGSAFAHAGENGFALALGADSHAIDLGYGNTSIAIGPRATAVQSATNSLAVALGEDNNATTYGAHSVALVLGGSSNQAEAGGYNVGPSYGDVAVVTGGDHITALAQGANRIVTIEPQGEAPLDLSIAVNGETLFQSGSAHATTAPNGVAVAYGNNSTAAADGQYDFALAIGDKNTAMTEFGYDDVAISLGTNNHAIAATHSGANVAGVLGGTGNTATAYDRSIVLILSGDNQTADPRGPIHIVPPLQLF
jgi:PE family